MGVECHYYLLPRPNTFRPTGDQVRRFVDLLRTAGWAPTEPVQGQEGTRLGDPVHAEEGVSIEDGLRLIPPSGAPGRDLCFYWSFPEWDRTQARFPFVAEPEQGFTSWYYDLELHVMADGYFAHDADETVELIEDSRCSCGQELDWNRVDVGWYSIGRPLTPREQVARRVRSVRSWLRRWRGRETSAAEQRQEPDVERGRAVYREYFGGDGVGINFSPIRAISRLRDHCPSCGQPFDPTGRIARAKDPMTAVPYTIPGGITYRFALMIECGKSLPIDLAPTNRLKPELLDLCQRHFGADFYEVGAYG